MQRACATMSALIKQLISHQTRATEVVMRQVRIAFRLNMFFLLLLASVDRTHAIDLVDVPEILFVPTQLVATAAMYDVIKNDDERTKGFVEDFVHSKLDLQIQLNKVRREYWTLYPNGNGIEAVKLKYEGLLTLKDLHELLMVEMPRLLTSNERPDSFLRRFRGVFNFVAGGSIDAGIHPYASRDFEGFANDFWMSAFFDKPVSGTIHTYEEYLRTRNRAEYLFYNPYTPLDSKDHKVAMAALLCALDNQLSAEVAIQEVRGAIRLVGSERFDEAAKYAMRQWPREQVVTGKGELSPESTIRVFSWIATRHDPNLFALYLIRRKSLCSWETAEQVLATRIKRHGKEKFDAIAKEVWQAANVGSDSCIGDPELDMGKNRFNPTDCIASRLGSNEIWHDVYAMTDTSLNDKKTNCEEFAKGLWSGEEVSSTFQEQTEAASSVFEEILGEELIGRAGFAFSNRFLHLLHDEPYYQPEWSSSALQRVAGARYGLFRLCEGFSAISDPKKFAVIAMYRHHERNNSLTEQRTALLTSRYSSVTNQLSWPEEVAAQRQKDMTALLQTAKGMKKAEHLYEFLCKKFGEDKVLAAASKVGTEIGYSPHGWYVDQHRSLGFNDTTSDRIRYYLGDKEQLIEEDERRQQFRKQLEELQLQEYKVANLGNKVESEQKWLLPKGDELILTREDVWNVQYALNQWLLTGAEEDRAAALSKKKRTCSQK
jgi:hypothetical protein